MHNQQIVVTACKSDFFWKWEKWRVLTQKIYQIYDDFWVSDGPTNHGTSWGLSNPMILKLTTDERPSHFFPNTRSELQFMFLVKRAWLLCRWYGHLLLISFCFASCFHLQVFRIMHNGKRLWSFVLFELSGCRKKANSNYAHCFTLVPLTVTLL